MHPTALFRLYQIGANVVLPFAALRAIRKLRRAGVSTQRAHERLGHPTLSRPLGALIWFHAASVGEARSVLPLMARLHGSAQLLLTTGTASALLAVERHLPDGAMHQFSPLDGYGPVKRFLDYWKPDVCVLVESELWPTSLDMCAKHEIPLALINARLSERSARHWRKFPTTAKYLLRGIRTVHCQNTRSLEHFRALGLHHAAAGQNLKSIIAPTNVDAATIGAMQEALSGRPVWLATSTHAADDKIVLSAHQRLLKTHPNLCLILVPRHLERTEWLRDRIIDTGLTAVQRSTGHILNENTQVYLADTVGETGLWHSLSPIVFVGGTFSNAGGHTPYEPAAAYSAILHGPKYQNFLEVYPKFAESDACIQVNDAVELADAVHMLLTHPSRVAQLAINARQFVSSDTELPGDLAKQLLSLIETQAEMSRD